MCLTSSLASKKKNYCCGCTPMWLSLKESHLKVTLSINKLKVYPHLPWPLYIHTCTEARALCKCILLANLWIYNIITVLCFPRTPGTSVTSFLESLCFVPYIYTAHSNFLILSIKTFLSVTRFFRLLFLPQQREGTKYLGLL